MKFEDVARAADALSALLTKLTGRSLVEQITVEQPSGSEDELYFIRLVHWTYVLFNEAGQPVFKELQRLVKSMDSQKAGLIGSGKRDIDALRAYTAHNLPPTSSSSERTKRLAIIWLRTHGGGPPPNWASCCEALCALVHGMVKALADCLTRATDTEEEARELVSSILAAVDNHWEAYEFDSILDTATENIDLKGLDLVAYRNSRYSEWRDLAGLFSTRDEARIAMSRAILAEVTHLFGSAPHESN